MPSRHEITNEIVGNRQDAVRRKYLKEYYEHTGRNLILFATAYGSKKLAIQHQEFMKQNVVCSIQ